MLDKLGLSLLFVPLAAAVLRAVLYFFPGSGQSDDQRHSERLTWLNCFVLALITAVVGISPFPVGFLLANVTSLVGIRLLFNLSFFETAFAFTCNLVALSILVYFFARYIVPPL